MRLFLLPISTRRTLLYCQRLNLAAADQASSSLVDKITQKATRMWTDWERKEKGWQKTVVNYGNQAMRRISFEEWGLKSIPPLSKKRQTQEVQGLDKIQVVYPESVIPTTHAAQLLQALGLERQALHKKRLVWCVIGMPISAPFALVPIIPNLPFFYLVYRAWSHYRALAGGKHIQFLCSNNLLALSPSLILNSIYKPLTRPIEPASAATEPANETMLLENATGREIVKALAIPELEVEIDRAISQVEAALRQKKVDDDQKASEQSQSPSTKADRKDPKG